MEQNTKSHQLIIDKLKENGIEKIPTEGIQLFTNQLRDYYSIGINYISTGVHVHKNDIDESEIADDKLIKLCKTWECNI